MFLCVLYYLLLFFLVFCFGFFDCTYILLFLIFLKCLYFLVYCFVLFVFCLLVVIMFSGEIVIFFLVF